MPDELAIDSGALIFATLADVYLSSGMVDEAISILKDGLSRNPAYTLAKIILGRAYYIKGDIEEALKILEEAHNEAKDSENANLYLGHCHRKLGEYDKAIQYYEATLKTNPENKEAKEELAALRPEEKKPEEVVKEPAEKVEEKVEEVVPQPVETVEEKIVGAPEPVKTVEEEKVEKAPEPTAKPEVVEAVAIPVEAETPEGPLEMMVEEEIKEEEEKVEEKEVETVPEPAKVVEKKAEAMPAEVKEAPEVAVPLESLTKPMDSLLDIKTVKGAFICSKDGLLIQNNYKDRADIEEICAMIAAIYNEAEDSFRFLKEKNLEKFIIEKSDETICVITAGESLLTVITKPETKPGLVFVYARKIIEEIREILG
jgi:predicted regulator of Ras-like GTPase activity (Roadblock/LC7/MglB family)